MSSKRIPDIDAATAAHRAKLALQWREDWRREMAGGASPPPPPRAPKPNGADFARAIARAEFGRRYVDPRTSRQAIENGAVVLKDVRPRRRE